MSTEDATGGQAEGRETYGSNSGCEQQLTGLDRTLESLERFQTPGPRLSPEQLSGKFVSLTRELLRGSSPGSFAVKEAEKR